MKKPRNEMSRGGVEPLETMSAAERWNDFWKTAADESRGVCKWRWRRMKWIGGPYWCDGLFCFSEWSALSGILARSSPRLKGNAERKWFLVIRYFGTYFPHMGRVLLPMENLIFRQPRAIPLHPIYRYGLRDVPPTFHGVIRKLKWFYSNICHLCKHKSIGII